MNRNAKSITIGVLLGFVAFAVFSFSDASVKLIQGELSPYESAFFGALFALAVLPFTLRPGDRWSDIFTTSNRPLWLVRFLTYPMGVIGSVTAFTHLPMAEAFVLIFLQPAFVSIMSMLFLKERMGARRWWAVVVGFVGVLVVLRPGFHELSIGHLGAIFAGLSGAISMVVFRAVRTTEKPIALFGACVLGAIVVCGLFAIPNFAAPTIQQWAKLAGYGLLAALANVLTMRAALHAPATHIGPTQYSQMLWAILLDYLLFNIGLDVFTLAGMVLIIGSGLLTLLGENARRVAPQPASAVRDTVPVTSGSD